MKILAFDCSAAPASVAITENGKIIGSSFINVKLTHSQTLLPMADALLKATCLTMDDIGGICISQGPGSFTGVRIGISAVKGLATPKNLPCVGVSTLECIAQNFINTDCIVCSVMDARCNQVYNALFRIKDGKIKRLTPDRAIICSDLVKELRRKRSSTPIIIAGDGAALFYGFCGNLKNAVVAEERARYQNAVSVALSAEKQFAKGNTLSADQLLPIYLRLPQAQRELNKKRG